MTTAERFWAKVSFAGECWEWQASRNQQGYGTFQLDRKARRAHRVAWQLTNGPEGHTTHPALARKYGVHPWTIKSVLNRTMWAHI